MDDAITPLIQIGLGLLGLVILLSLALGWRRDRGDRDDQGPEADA